jgi:competence protein ComEC
MPANKAHLWHYAPFLRFLLPLIAGIILQWYLSFSLFPLVTLCSVCLAFILVYSLLPDKRKFQLSFLNGIIIHLLLAGIGCCIVWLKDIRHSKDWIGYKYTSDHLVVRLLEPLVEKQNSYKALADVQYISINNHYQKAEGKIIIYFAKKSPPQSLHYGSQIILRKSLQPIKNSGNPGSFDYQQYCLFQGITHQVYLTAEEFQILPTDKKKSIHQIFI